MAPVVRAERRVSAFTASVLRAVHHIDPEQPSTTSGRWRSGSIDRWVRWLNMVLVSAFAAVALALCSIGVYGVIAFGVATQRREFGIRLALGASRRGITASVLSQALVLSAIGIGTGLILAAMLAQAMTSLLFGISAGDFSSFVAATVSVLGVALLAGYLPARRAATVEPAITLRGE